MATTRKRTRCSKGRKDTLSLFGVRADLGAPFSCPSVCLSACPSLCGLPLSLSLSLNHASILHILSRAGSFVPSAALPLWSPPKIRLCCFLLAHASVPTCRLLLLPHAHAALCLYECETCLSCPVGRAPRSGKVQPVGNVPCRPAARADLLRRGWWRQTRWLLSLSPPPCFGARAQGPSPSEAGRHARHASHTNKA